MADPTGDEMTASGCSNEGTKTNNVEDSSHQCDSNRIRRVGRLINCAGRIVCCFIVSYAAFFTWQNWSLILAAPKQPVPLTNRVPAITDKIASINDQGVWHISGLSCGLKTSVVNESQLSGALGTVEKSSHASLFDLEQSKTILQFLRELGLATELVGDRHIFSYNNEAIKVIVEARVQANEELIESVRFATPFDELAIATANRWTVFDVTSTASHAAPQHLLPYPAQLQPICGRSVNGEMQVEIARSSMSPEQLATFWTNAGWNRQQGNSAEISVFVKDDDRVFVAFAEDDKRNQTQVFLYTDIFHH